MLFLSLFQRCTWCLLIRAREKGSSNEVEMEAQVGKPKKRPNLNTYSEVEKPDRVRVKFLLLLLFVLFRFLYFGDLI